LVTIVIAIFGALLAFNWLLIYKEFKKRIKNLERDFETYKKNISETNAEFYKVKEKEIVELFVIEERKINSLAAFIFQNSNLIGISIYFLVKALEASMMLKEDKNIRQMVNTIIQTVNNEPLKTEKKIYNLDEVKIIITRIPNILFEEKEKLISFFNECSNSVI
jgi:hypothetical protein